MSGRRILNALSLALLLSALGAARGAAADSVGDFYRGKTIRFVIGFGAGDGFDVYARLAARYMGAHIPGEPTIIVQNMPGAGSLTALNYVLNAAPHDGTVIGMVNPVTTTDPLFQPQIARYDAAALPWLGSITSDYINCGFWRKEPVTLHDLQTKPFVVGSTATNGGSYAGDMVFSNVLHLNFKVVPGYGNMGELTHAAEKGEVDGFCGVMAMTLKSALWGTYTNGNLQIAVRAMLQPDPEMPDVPNAFDLVHSDEERQLLMLMAGPWYYGRPMLAPPGLPPERLAALRAAFDATMRDPALLAEAKHLNMEIHPVSADEIVATIKKIYEAPKPVIERAKPLFGVSDK